MTRAARYRDRDHPTCSSDAEQVGAEGEGGGQIPGREGSGPVAVGIGVFD